MTSTIINTLLDHGIMKSGFSTIALSTADTGDRWTITIGFLGVTLVGVLLLTALIAYGRSALRRRRRARLRLHAIRANVVAIMTRPQGAQTRRHI